MRSAVLSLVLLVLLVSYHSIDARRKGEENWKQRYRKWKESEEQAQRGPLIGTDEANSYREVQNSVYDVSSEKEGIPSEKDLWRQKIEEKKQRIEGKKQRQKDIGLKPNSEITAWHEEKMRRRQELYKVAPHELQRQKRHQLHTFRTEGPADAVVTQRPPPPHEKVAEMARYIVYYSNWTAVAYTSRQPETFGLPMADVFSVCDGPEMNSTGIPYMYISPKDLGVQDLAKDSRCSLAMSLAQGDFCREGGLDPEDPRCAHVFLTGKLKTVKNGSDEWARVEKFFFERHPHLRNMPKDHKFRFAKLKISNILVQDYFGGPAAPTLAEYFAAKPENIPHISTSKPSPIPEAEAELLPGASASDTVKWIGPIE